MATSSRRLLGLGLLSLNQSPTRARDDDTIENLQSEPEPDVAGPPAGAATSDQSHFEGFQVGHRLELEASPTNSERIDRLKPKDPETITRRGLSLHLFIVLFAI